MRKHPAPRDPGLIEIDAWEQWLLSAQLQTIAANLDMYPAERERAIAEATRLSAAIGEQRRYEYLTWKTRLV